MQSNISLLVSNIGWCDHE